jgi:hypothetical protein
LAREELSKNIGAQPPTLSGENEQRSLEILTALGACVRARRWAGRRVWARMWGRRRLRA